MAVSNTVGSPLVTVVTPAYNVAKYVGEAVDSVLRQTFHNFEYLVVDDGSADNSADVVKAHAGDDPRFRLVAGEHRGLSAATERGDSGGERGVHRLSRWRRPVAPEISGAAAPADSVVAAGCWCRVLPFPARAGKRHPGLLQWQRAGGYDFDDFLVNGNPARNGSSLLIRKSCFTDVGVFDEKLAYNEDIDMWLRIAENSKTPILWASRYFLVDLRLRPGSMTRDRAGIEAALHDMLEVADDQASPVASGACLRSSGPNCIQVWRK